MEKNLYIDASHPNQTRIVLKSDTSIEEYEFEDKTNLNFKNNSKITKNIIKNFIEKLTNLNIYPLLIKNLTIFRH